MSQIHKAIFAALAVALTCGAVQFASGHDLAGLQAAVVAPETGINRAAKADRAAVVPARGQTQTIALRVEGVADTSVLVRVPVAEETRARPAAPAFAKPGKTAMACEPVVSVLTEVAKLLQPGRCVT
jgi:predicted transcriptional regulator